MLLAKQKGDLGTCGNAELVHPTLLLCSERLSEHNSMAVRRCHSHLSFTPRLAFGASEDQGTLRVKLAMQGVHVVHRDIRKVAVVADFVWR